MALNYTKKTWVNGSQPYLNDTNLNYLDTGVEYACDAIDNQFDLSQCTISDSGTALSVTSGASTVDGQLATAIISTFSYADAKAILGLS